MARRHGSGRQGPAWLLALVVLVAVVGAAWWFSARTPVERTEPEGTQTPPASGVLSADHVDAANEGRLISVEGTLRVVAPPRDPQLGISAEALVLLRKVEMRQWRETCTANGCDYALAWSAEPIDSRAFKVAQGHENPPVLPFSSERFLAGDVRLGAFKVDAAFAADDAEAVAYPVSASQLPPNLAATFREHEGALYTGNDPADAAAGDLRVSYQVISAGPRRLGGVQLGDRLQPSATP